VISHAQLTVDEHKFVCNVMHNTEMIRHDNCLPELVVKQLLLLLVAQPNIGRGSSQADKQLSDSSPDANDEQWLSQVSTRQLALFYLFIYYNNRMQCTNTRPNYSMIKMLHIK